MPRVWNPFDATRATSACGETFLPELRHGSYRRASFLQRLRNKNGMMYNSYFKERRNHGFLYKLRDKCPGWHKILYLMWYADVGTGTTASPSKPMCSRNLRLSHYRSRLMPRHRNRLTHNLNRDTWLRRAIRTLRFPREASMNRSRRVGISVSSC